MQNKATRTAATFLYLTCVIAITQWGLDRFWLYHAQNRVLAPSDYTVSVLPGSAEVTGDLRRSDDGQFVVKVTTLGTSHAMDHITNSLLPVVLVAIIGLAMTWYAAKRPGPSAGA